MTKRLLLTAIVLTSASQIVHTGRDFALLPRDNYAMRHSHQDQERVPNAQKQSVRPAKQGYSQTDLAFTMPTHRPETELAFTMPTHRPETDLAFTMPTHRLEVDVAFTMPTHRPQSDLAFTMPTHRPEVELAFTMPAHHIS